MLHFHGKIVWRLYLVSSFVKNYVNTLFLWFFLSKKLVITILLVGSSNLEQVSRNFLTIFTQIQNLGMSYFNSNGYQGGLTLWAFQWMWWNISYTNLALWGQIIQCFSEPMEIQVLNTLMSAKHSENVSVLWRQLCIWIIYSKEHTESLSVFWRHLKNDI